MLSKTLCLVPKTYYLVLLQTISSYHHTIPNSTTIPFLILLHSTTICHSTIYCLFATKIYHPPTLPTTTNSTTFYNHIQFYNLLHFSYKKSTINQLYQLWNFF